MEFNTLALFWKRVQAREVLYILFKVYLLHTVDTHPIKIAHKGLLQTWGLKLVKRIGPELSSCWLLQLQLELRITWTFLPWKYTVLCQDKVGLRGQLLPCFVWMAWGAYADATPWIRRYDLVIEGNQLLVLRGICASFLMSNFKMQQHYSEPRSRASGKGRLWRTTMDNFHFGTHVPLNHCDMVYWKKSEPIMCNDVHFAWR